MKMNVEFCHPSRWLKRVYGIVFSCLLIIGMLPFQTLSVYAESPYDDSGMFGIGIIEDGAYINVDGMDDLNGDLQENPYWKNDPDHAGKLIPASETDYNLKYENGKLYLNGLNLTVNCAGGVNAIYANVDLEIVMEADSKITGQYEVPLMAEQTLTFSGTGSLTIEVTDSEDSAAILAGGTITHNGTGIITLIPAGEADGIWWMDEACEILGDGAWEGLPVTEEPSYDAPGSFGIGIGEDWTGLNVEGFDFDGNMTVNPYWKNDPEHEGKLVPGTADDYNLKYEEGTLYLNGLNLIVNCFDGQNAIYAAQDLNIVIEADSSIAGYDGCPVMAENAMTFSGPGNLTIEAWGEEDIAPLLAGSDITHNGTGIITLVPAGEADGIWWIDEACEILGDGKWEGFNPDQEEPQDAFYRTVYTDGEEHVGYAGCYMTAEEYEYGDVFYEGTQEEIAQREPLYWVHGETIQEVIDKLNGDIPVTFYDGSTALNVTVDDVRTDYISINTSSSNYVVEQQTEQYITSTGDFKGIALVGSYDKQMTNHDPDDNYYPEDEVHALTEEYKDLFKELADKYGLDLNGVDLDAVSYISWMYATEGIYVAEKRSGVDAGHPYLYDLGSLIANEEAINAALEKYNAEHTEAPVDLYLDILSEDSLQDVGMPFPVLHINSECDFVISGNFSAIQTPGNQDGVNIFFGFLPDTDHSVSFVNANEQNRHIDTYTKADIENGSIRGIIEVTSGVYSVAGMQYVPIRILMYQHITDGSVSGDYAGSVVMDEERIPDAKLLADVDITDAQLDILEAGGAVDVDLSVDELDITDAKNQDAAEDIEKLLKDNGTYEDSFYLDMNMAFSIRDEQNEKISFADGKDQMPLTNLQVPVKLDIEVPDTMKSQDEDREYAVVRRHENADGSVTTEILPVIYNEKTGILTFETDRFSTYAIVSRKNRDTEEPKTETPSTEEPGTEAPSGNAAPETPKTGDEMPLAWGMLLLGASLCGVFGLLRIRRKIKQAE